MIVALIGLRASGKSTLGPGLASALNAPFTDLDAVVAQRMGYPTAGQAFAADRERFRATETECLGELVKQEPHVIALGGGTPEAPGVAGVLAATRVIYLRATPATLRARLASSTEFRPSVTGAGTLEEVDELWRRRDPLYRGMAAAVIDVDGLSIHAALTRVLQALGIGHGQP